jgi:energy-coupling factor transporter transmembrane protein EcfT
MLDWAPLGKLVFAIAILIVNLVSSSMLVPLVTMSMGLILMAYSTNFKIPLIIAFAILEAFLILIIGCGLISVTGLAEDPGIWDTDFLWMHWHMTEASFNTAWLILLRGTAGITVMLSFATSTPIPHMSLALKQVRMPVEISEIVVLIYRYAFLLLERMEAMWNAAHSRLGFNGFRNNISTVAAIAVGIFIQSTNLSEKSQVALECRNYRGYFPVYREPAKMGLKWLVLIIVVFAVLYMFGKYTEGWINMAQLWGALW